MPRPRPFNRFIHFLERSQSKIVMVVVLLLFFSSGLFYLIIAGKTRAAPRQSNRIAMSDSATSTQKLVARHLDGVMVPVGEEALMPRAIMIENEMNGRPLSGLSKANLVIEAPVEGGVTRFLAFFDATTTIPEVGPIRSARPYFIDWMKGWNALYFHVGGSPEALSILAASPKYLNHVDEMREGRFFWRSGDRLMPYNAYTNSDLINQAAMERASSTASVAWHFQDASSTRQGGVATAKVGYGGTYSVIWKFDREKNFYERFQGGKRQKDTDGTQIESENVMVIKSDARVLDEIGRLRLRTIGSGDALAYRDGNRYAIRWRRAAGDPIKFETRDGKEFLLNRGRTWIEVTTDDQMFAGLEK